MKATDTDISSLLRAKARLAREFRYDESVRAEIIQYCRPFLQSARLCDDLTAGAVCIRRLETRVGSWLEDYAIQRLRPNMRLQEHKTGLREATDATWRLADKYRRLGQWRAAEVLYAVARHAERVTGNLNGGPHRKKGMHDEMRFWLCANVIEILESETRKLPVQSRTSVAARLLITAVDPVMQYARDALECKKAAPLGNGGKAEYMIARWLGLFKFVQPWDDRKYA